MYDYLWIQFWPVFKAYFNFFFEEQEPVDYKYGGVWTQVSALSFNPFWVINGVPLVINCHMISAEVTCTHRHKNSPVICVCSACMP